MFKVPYFLEGISNIFKPVLTNKEKFENAKGAENYRGKLIFGHYEILTGEKRSIFKAVRILNIVWYIEGIKMEFVLEYVLGKR